jgi:hypothetical protein
MDTHKVNWLFYLTLTLACIAAAIWGCNAKFAPPETDSNGIDEAMQLQQTIQDTQLAFYEMGLVDARLWDIKTGGKEDLPAGCDISKKTFDPIACDIAIKEH